MRTRIWSLAAVVVLAYGCASSAPTSAPAIPATMQGVASWYGEEFAGRTTANGEIFDPRSLTAAHRTLPFGTVLDIKNVKTAQTVRVRVNDRGPYIGGRVIDLSYAAAQKIGLVEPGIGEVQITVVKIGSGDREPPVPFDVTIAEDPKTAPVPSAGDPPAVPFPLPNQPAVPATPAPRAEAEPEAVVDRVDVEVQRGDVITRRQIAEDGKTIVEVPIGRGVAPTASGYVEQRRDAARRERAAPRQQQQFFVQVGAFSIESNAKALQERLAAIGHRASIDREELYRVRIGPFATRDAAVQARTALETKGVSAMVIAD